MTATWDGSVPCHPYDAAGIVYVEVPRSGCSSLKTALAPLLGDVGDGVSLADIHQWTGYTMARDRGQLESWLRGRWAGYLKVTLVRHPVDRFLSFFHGISPAGRPAVDAFVLGGHPDWLDIHGRPQTAIIGDPAWYDVVGRLEELRPLEGALSSRVGRPIRLPHVNSSHWIEQPREALGPDALGRVRTVYRADFEGLGYEP